QLRKSLPGALFLGRHGDIGMLGGPFLFAVFTVAGFGKENGAVEEDSVHGIGREVAQDLENPISERAVDAGTQAAVVNPGNGAILVALHPIVVLAGEVGIVMVNIEMDRDTEAALFGFGEIAAEIILVGFSRGARDKEKTEIIHSLTAAHDS